MVHSLYWISSLTYATILIIILLHDIKVNHTANDVEKAFRLMTAWVIFFCLQDTFWGLCGSQVIKGDKFFFIASSIFHTSTVITTFFWLYYILIFVGEKFKKRKIFLFIDGMVIFFELCLVFSNFFTPTIFYIKDGEYITSILRPIAFFNQYVVYLLIGIITLFTYLRIEKNDYIKKERYRSVFLSTLIPILLGIFQFLYPDAPFYSLGYFFGCFILHIFVITKDRELANKVTHMELLLQSNYDELTGLLNRRAFDSEMQSINQDEISDRLIIVSMDINGLKVVNDTLGHFAGDELLKGASECMKQCFSTYGKVFRTGGDEFAAVLYASKNQFEEIIQDFEDIMHNWHGQNINSVSISYGYVDNFSVKYTNSYDMLMLADERMYEAKSEFYKKNGINQANATDAHITLCTLYTKILKINLTTDSYEIMNLAEKDADYQKEIPNKLSAWLIDFGRSGNVHPDDLNEYYMHTSLFYLRKYFSSRKTALHLFYRRKYGNEYKQSMLEIIVADDYSEDNQSLYLYVKNIE